MGRLSRTVAREEKELALAVDRSLRSVLPLQPLIGEDKHYSNGGEKGKSAKNYEESSIWVHDLISIPSKRCPTKTLGACRAFVNVSGFGL